jgi:hypothetical protein
MNEKIDKVITPTDIANLKSAVDALGTKLDGVGLTAKELRKGGWFLSKKSELLFKDTLRIAKQRPADFPKLDVAAFERDVQLLDAISNLQTQIRLAETLVEHAHRRAVKDASEQSLYVYNTIRVYYQIGALGGEMYKRLKEFMPRTKKQD